MEASCGDGYGGSYKVYQPEKCAIGYWISFTKTALNCANLQRPAAAAGRDGGDELRRVRGAGTGIRSGRQERISDNKHGKWRELCIQRTQGKEIAKVS